MEALNKNVRASLKRLILKSYEPPTAFERSAERARGYERKAPERRDDGRWPRGLRGNRANRAWGKNTKRAEGGMRTSKDNASAGRQTTLLRGAMVYRLQLRPGQELLHYDFLPSSKNNQAAWDRRAKLRDMRPRTALGKLDLLEHLVLKLQKCEGERLPPEWIVEAQRLIAAGKSALEAEDSGSAVSTAIDAAMLVGDLVAELHVPRDMKRQLGVQEGGKAMKLRKGILLAAETLAREHRDWSAQQAWKHLTRVRIPEINGFAFHVDEDDYLVQRNTETKKEAKISNSSFHRYWRMAKEAVHQVPS